MRPEAVARRRRREKEEENARVFAFSARWPAGSGWLAGCMETSPLRFWDLNFGRQDSPFELLRGWRCVLHRILVFRELISDRLKKALLKAVAGPSLGQDGTCRVRVPDLTPGIDLWMTYPY